MSYNAQLEKQIFYSILGRSTLLSGTSFKLFKHELTVECQQQIYEGSQKQEQNSLTKSRKAQDTDCIQSKF